VPASPSSGPFPTATLRALIDRLIPTDEFPGAVEAGVEVYIGRQLAGDCAGEADFLTAGLWLLESETKARHGREADFSRLEPEKQDALLKELEAGRARTDWPTTIRAADFFARLVDLTHEGYYADPSNGGNRDAVSWRMIGYHPRLPPKTS
jgi:hypothetical protein